jgi:hypothetical protein
VNSTVGAEKGLTAYLPRPWVAMLPAIDLRRENVDIIEEKVDSGLKDDDRSSVVTIEGDVKTRLEDDIIVEKVHVYNKSNV